MFWNRSLRLLRPRLFAVNFSAAPLASLSEVQVGDNVRQLADSLCSLNLVETAQLVSLLQKRLNLGSLVQAAAASPTQHGAAAPPAAEAPKAAEKTDFKVMLQKIDPASKAKIIREIKLILPQLNLVEAKTLVESAPKLIKEKVKRDEAEKMKKTLEELGATVSLD